MASGFPCSLGGSESDAECLGPFEKMPSLDAREKPLWKDNSFYVGESFTCPNHHLVGRGTHCFVTFESQTRQQCTFKDTSRVYEVQASIHKCTLPKLTTSSYVLDHRYPSPWILSESDWRQHTRSRIILAATWTPLPEFLSTHSFVSCIYNAVLAHKTASTLLPNANRPEISIGNIIFAQEPDGACTGLLVDWDLAKCGDDGEKRRASERTGMRQFKAARLCSPSPPPRTIGDDVESFILLLLWMAARYAPNNMTPSERGSFLGKFDATDGSSKKDMIVAGIANVVGLKLLSWELKLVLTVVMNKCRWRYQVLSPLDRNNAEAAEALKQQQALLEGHDWLIDILSTALQNEAWANDDDCSRKEQTVEPTSEVPYAEQALRIYGDG